MCLGFGKGGNVKAAMGLSKFDSPFMHGWFVVCFMLKHFLSHILKFVWFLFFGSILLGGVNGVGI
jgi:hypothetical protein